MWPTQHLKSWSHSGIRFIPPTTGQPQPGVGGCRFRLLSATTVSSAEVGRVRREAKDTEWQDDMWQSASTSAKGEGGRRARWWREQRPRRRYGVRKASRCTPRCSLRTRGYEYTGMSSKWGVKAKRPRTARRRERERERWWNEIKGDYGCVAEEGGRGSKCANLGRCALCKHCACQVGARAHDPQPTVCSEEDANNTRGTLRGGGQSNRIGWPFEKVKSRLLDKVSSSVDILLISSTSTVTYMYWREMKENLLRTLHVYCDVLRGRDREVRRGYTNQDDRRRFL